VKSAIDVLGDVKELKAQKELLKTVSSLISDTQVLLRELKTKIEKANSISSEEKKAAYFCEEIKKSMLDIRVKADTLENYVDNELWPMPKYWEMLFIC
jgi:glutamine synthetase